MNYAVILASGKGTRIKDNSKLPKQFRLIQEKPVIIYTLRKFLNIKKFNAIYIAVAKEYVDYTKDLISKYITEKENIHIVCGGKERLDSIINAINAIQENQGCQEDDIVVIHDAVRPFVTPKILQDSIDNEYYYLSYIQRLL